MVNDFSFSYLRKATNTPSYWKYGCIYCRKYNCITLEERLQVIHSRLEVLERDCTFGDSELSIIVRKILLPNFFQTFCSMFCVLCQFSYSVVFRSLQPHGLESTSLFCPRTSLGENTGMLFPPPGCPTNPWIEFLSPVSPELAGRFLTREPTGKHVFM